MKERGGVESRQNQGDNLYPDPTERAAGDTVDQFCPGLVHFSSVQEPSGKLFAMAPHILLTGGHSPHPAEAHDVGAYDTPQTVQIVWKLSPKVNTAGSDDTPTRRLNFLEG